MNRIVAFAACLLLSAPAWAGVPGGSYRGIDGRSHSYNGIKMGGYGTSSSSSSSSSQPRSFYDGLVPYGTYGNHGWRTESDGAKTYWRDGQRVQSVGPVRPPSGK